MMLDISLYIVIQNCLFVRYSEREYFPLEILIDTKNDDADLL